MLITFEGLDYSGKSTQVKRVIDRLSREGKRVLLVREPGGTGIGEKIRAILLDKDLKGMTDISELFLFSASRAQLVAEVIKPALAAGTLVVCDRFYDSTTAYQGWGRGIPLKAVQEINKAATFGVVPDLTIFLDVGLDEIERRFGNAKAGRDRMESNDRRFHEQVRNGYLELARTEPRYIVVNGERPAEAIHEEIWKHITEHLRKASSS